MMAKIALCLQRLASATWYAGARHGGNPYVMDTKKRFLVEREELPLRRIKFFRSTDEREPVFICFQTGILLLMALFFLQRVQMLIKDLALSKNP